MKIVLIQTGKTTDRNVAAIAELYETRISRYNPFGIITIPDIRYAASLPVQEQKAREGEKIMKSLSEDDYLVLLDERGAELRTADFANWLQKSLMMSKKRIVFAIGGPWGFPEAVYGRADTKISLSRMTFPHQLVRLLFLEQLYRAFTILRGEPYHHE